ncbi:PREDICTED: mucin-16-like, partial [Galeopterus variegatus]|uniref:Mucin-16-like n=1 Tax=Galeopterus variegatus TaxID=482537 RepID=A0ABM0S988_GALVR
MDSTSDKILATSKDTTDTQEVNPSTNTTVTSVGTTSSEHELHSSVSANSLPSNATSAVVTTSTVVATKQNPTIYTSMPESLDVTRMQLESTSSVTSRLRETSTSTGTSTDLYKAIS